MRDSTKHTPEGQFAIASSAQFSFLWLRALPTGPVSLLLPSVVVVGAGVVGDGGVVVAGPNTRSVPGDAARPGASGKGEGRN